MTAASSAGGTALTLAKLGAEVRSGAIGPDAVGDMLLSLLKEGGVLPVRAPQRLTDVRDVLPIRRTGERRAFHVGGANGTYGPGDVPGTRSTASPTSTSAGPSSWAARLRRRS